MISILRLVGVCKTTHTTHDTKDIVVSGIDTDLSGLCSTDSGSRNNKLKSSVVNSGEIACTRWLVLFRAKGKWVNIDTSVWVTCVVLVWLNKVEVGTFTLTEAVLSVKLKLSGNDWVLSPAVHVKCGLSKHECSSIRYTGITNIRDWERCGKSRGGAGGAGKGIGSFSPVATFCTFLNDIWCCNIFECWSTK